MKKLFFVIMVIIVFAIASCGNKKTVVNEQKTDSTAVKVEVVDTTAVK
jgi:predicted small lipoprotein YifL